MPSAKVLEEKKLLVSELAQVFQSAQTLVVADYRGLTVAQDTELRQAMRKAGVQYKVIKNTMAVLAAREAKLDGLEEIFQGPTAIAYSDSDPIAPAKVIKEYAKKFDPLEVKGGAYEGQVADLATLDRLASIPSKETLLSQLVFMLNAPITGLARGLSEIAKKMEAEGGVCPAAAQEEEACACSVEAQSEEACACSVESQPEEAPAEATAE